MSYTKQTVAVNSDEKTFIKTFVQQLTQADSRITCNTDIDAQFASTSNTPIFTVNFGTNSRIVFKRQNGLVVNVKYYNVTIIINGTQTAVQLVYSASDLYSGSVVTRTWKFAVAANESAVYIAFGDYNTNIPDSAKFSVMSISDGEFSAAAFAQSAYALNGEFYCTNGSAQNVTVKFTDRLNYEAEGGSVEIIKNKALLDSTKTTKITDFTGLCDCSTVTAFSFLRIDNDSYYTINNHTLMKLNAEEQ